MTEPAPSQARIALLRNGYVPLPANRTKAVTIPGWTRIPRDKITEDWIYEQSDEEYPATGLRCDDIFGFDIDTEDAELSKHLIGHIAHLSTVFRTRPSSRKVTILLASSGGPGSYYMSEKWIDQGGETHGFEIHASPKHQFIAYGPHEKGGRYVWPGASPLTVPRASLPAISPDQVRAIAKEMEATLRAHAKARRWQQAKGLSIDGFETKHVLEAKMIFTCFGGSPGAPEGPTRLHEMEHYLQTSTHQNPTIKCNLDGVRPSSDSRAGLARLAREGGYIVIADFAHRTIWRKVESEEDPTSATQQLALALPPDPLGDRRGSTDGDGGDGGGDGSGGTGGSGNRGTINILLNDWFYIADENACSRRTSPNRSVGMAGFKNLYPQRTNSGSVVDAWLKHARCQKAEHRQFDPRRDPGIYTAGDVRLLNTYFTPILGSAEGGETDTFFEFLDRLVPNPKEYNYVLDWIATKVAHPHYRLHGLVMVAEHQGTGRNTLKNILGRLIGEDYVKSISMEILTGQNYQAQYTDYLQESLLVFVEEARDNAGTKVNDWNARKKAYEHLKMLVDPTAKRLHIVRKQISSVQQEVFASFLIASNHHDALAIEPGDRRFLVIENGAPLSEDFAMAQRINDWLRNSRNIAALKLRLLELAKSISYNPFGHAPMTRAKGDMIKSNESPMERAIGELRTRLRNSGIRYFTPKQVFDFVWDFVEDETDASPQQIKIAVGKAIKKWATFAERNNSEIRIRFEGVQTRVYVWRDARDHTIPASGLLQAHLDNAAGVLGLRGLRVVGSDSP